eukprot:scaffold20092_cov45-Isochrysis_galbana.AAC.1
MPSLEAYPTPYQTASARRQLQVQLRRGVGMLLAEYTAGGGAEPPARSTGGGHTPAGGAAPARAEA